LNNNTIIEIISGNYTFFKPLI